MGRNASGTYTLPGAYNPVVPDTIIEAVWANTTLADVAAGLTQSLDRQGRGGMQAPLKLTNGSAAAPSLTFENEPTTGIFRADIGELRVGILGVQRFKLSAVSADFASAIRAQNGTELAPSISFTEATGTGFYHSSPANFRLAQAGVDVGLINLGCFVFRSAGVAGAPVARIDMNEFGNAQGFQAQGGSNVAFSALACVSSSAVAAGRCLIARSRRELPASANVAVNNGDYLGILAFSGDTGSDFLEGAHIRAQTEGTVSVSEMPTRLDFLIKRAGNLSPFAALSLDSKANLGLQTGLNTVGLVAPGNTAGCFLLGNAPVVPTGNYALGGTIYVSANALYYRAGTGTVTLLAAA